MAITDRMRKAFDDCTVMAGVENDFECVYIVKAAAMLYLDEIDAAFRELAQTTAKCQNGECDNCKYGNPTGYGCTWDAHMKELGIEVQA